MSVFADELLRTTRKENLLDDALAAVIGSINASAVTATPDQGEYIHHSSPKRSRSDLE